MLIKYALPVLAVAGVGLAAFTVAQGNRPVTPAPPVAQPAAAPFAANVPGAGLVEASTENIAIGAHVAGIVTGVYVKAGDRVKAGDPLFAIDDRSVRAEVAAREASLRAAKSQLDRMKAMPRTEDVPPAEARVQEQESLLSEAEKQLAFLEALPDRRAVSEQEWTTRRSAVATAKARTAQARAELALLKAGAWKEDLDVQAAAVQQAESQVVQMKTELERLTVKAPVDGEILKMNLRPGEYAVAGAMTEPLIWMGETETLHIRVDIDENDAWRVKPGAKAVAYVRGNTSLKTDASFVRFEPYVIPKRSLTGASGERVDTRVLQVIYRFKRSDLPVFVGQQMDVFIAAEPLGSARFGVDPAAVNQDLQGTKQ
jgi:HlyD family secretion protein